MGIFHSYHVLLIIDYSPRDSLQVPGPPPPLPFLQRKRKITKDLSSQNSILTRVGIELVWGGKKGDGHWQHTRTHTVCHPMEMEKAGNEFPQQRKS